jgi:hypothetical protein
MVGLPATPNIICFAFVHMVHHPTALPLFVVVSAANPGKKINFVQHDLQPALADQAAPYQLFGCNTASYYQGTLFRFPLRTQAQADASTISKQVRLISIGCRDASCVACNKAQCAGLRA